MLTKRIDPEKAKTIIDGMTAEIDPAGLSAALRRLMDVYLLSEDCEDVFIDATCTIPEKRQVYDRFAVLTKMLKDVEISTR